MKIVHHHPLNFLTTISYEIKGNTVVRTYKNLQGDMTFVIDIPNIRRIYPYRTSSNDLMNLGVFALVINALVNLTCDSIRSFHQWPFIRKTG